MPQLVVTLSSFLVGATGLFMLVLALAFAALPGKTALHRWGIAVFVLTAISLILSSAQHLIGSDRLPHFAHLSSLVVFYLCPTLAIYLRRAAWRDEPPPRAYPALFFPALAFTLAALPFYLRSAEEIRASLELLRSGRVGDFPVIFWMKRLSFAWAAAVLALICVDNLRLKRKARAGGKPIPSATILLFPWIILVWLLLCILVMVFDLRYLSELLPSQIVIVAPVIAIMLFRNPSLVPSPKAREGAPAGAGNPAPRGSYPVSRTSGMDLPAVLAALDRAMREEKLYLDEGLSLARLAEAVGLTPHQLSEVLNRELGLSFAAYVSEFRVEEACRRLREESDKAVLDIAYECGFSSKSTFNQVFAKKIGVSPTEYRRSSRDARG